MEGTPSQHAEQRPPTPPPAVGARRLYARPDVAPMLGLSYRRTVELMQQGRIRAYREPRGEGRKWYTFLPHVSEYVTSLQRVRGDLPGGPLPLQEAEFEALLAAPSPARAGTAPSPAGHEAYGSSARLAAAIAAERAPSRDDLAAVLVPAGSPEKRDAVGRTFVRIWTNMLWHAEQGAGDVALDRLVRLDQGLARSRERLEALIPGLAAASA